MEFKLNVMEKYIYISTYVCIMFALSLAVYGIKKENTGSPKKMKAEMHVYNFVSDPGINVISCFLNYRK